MRVAVIDLGSNTFHLLIADKSSGSAWGFEVLCKKRYFTALSEGGLGIIKQEAMERGWSALEDMKQLLDTYQPAEIKIIGTASLRNATNSPEFIRKATEICGRSIDIISGTEEAELIARGTCLIPALRTGTHLIMDIGGGSTEFILMKAGEIIFRESYNIGVGVLHHLFHHQEPIAGSASLALKNHLEETLQSLLHVLAVNNIEKIVGASGSFEVLQSMKGAETEIPGLIQSIPASEALTMIRHTVSLNFEERAKLQGIPKERVKLIVVAFLLMEYIIQTLQIKEIVVCPFAIKEGVLAKIMELSPSQTYRLKK
jgi:exopolyphosphatase/guanosine-5'-triphosphate,3'-diphosphate pyrophosphatase